MLKVLHPSEEVSDNSLGFSEEGFVLVGGEVKARVKDPAHGPMVIFSVNGYEVFHPHRKYRCENGQWREYVCGRPVVTREEMAKTDSPLPPEDPADLGD